MWSAWVGRRRGHCQPSSRPGPRSLARTVQELSNYGVLQHPVPVVNGQFQFGLDPVLLAIPWKALAWTQVHSGHLPLWNPYNVLGMPLAFNWESAPFSLSALVGYLAPLRLVFTVSVITSLVIGGTGVYVLCRVLRLGVLGAAMAGSVYELSGPFMTLLSWQDTAVLCWAGWLFAVALLILRGEHRVRHVVEFAVIVALAGYAGQPEALFFLLLSLGLFVGVIFLVRTLRKESVRSFVRPIGDLLVAGASGLALFAPLALPALQLSSISVRSRYEPIDNVTKVRAQSTSHQKERRSSALLPRPDPCPLPIVRRLAGQRRSVLRRSIPLHRIRRLPRCHRHHPGGFGRRGP